MNLNAFGVYSIVNTVTSTIYIGSTADSFKTRWRGHRKELRANRHNNVYLQNSWNKYGENAFVFSVLEYVDLAINVLPKEQHYIDIHFGKNCYNINPTAGSNKGLKIADTSRIAAANREINNRPEVIELKRQNMINRYLDPVERQKQSERLKKAYSTPEAKANKSKAMAKRWDIVLVAPSGERYTDIFNLKEFCREHNLSPSYMYETVAGKHKHCKGWVVERKE